MTESLLRNRYQIIQTLGEGGFGKTYLAQDLDMPSGRLCVIKQLKLISDVPEIYQIAKERFQREAAILERLGESHGQIPSLYGYFEQDGKFYLVQEWVEGLTLTQKISREGLLSESVLTQLLVEVLSILEYVHSQQIVHRDIKPDNIIVRSRDKRPVLIDFGAVKETVGTVLSPSGKSVTTLVIGTPGFMSSEQTMGRPGYSSDLYSLGLTAVFCLTGKIPQELENDFENDCLLWLPSQPIDPRLVQVINKAIELHPRDRYRSARLMLEALKPVMETVALDYHSNNLQNKGTFSSMPPTEAFSSSNTHTQHPTLLPLTETFSSPKTPTQPPTSLKAPPSQPAIDPDFIVKCERNLAEIIGPIAKLLVKNTLAKFPQIDKKALIETLAIQINNEQKADAFKRSFK